MAKQVIKWADGAGNLFDSEEGAKRSDWRWKKKEKIEYLLLHSYGFSGRNQVMDELPQWVVKYWEEIRDIMTEQDDFT